MSEITFAVRGLPPAKNEALSMLGERHSHAPRVRTLLEAAREAIGGDFAPFLGPVGLEVELRTPDDTDPWDATNYLGGIGDVLEVKSRRGALEHLGDLSRVALYENDRQIREVRYTVVHASEPTYRVRIWQLDPTPRAPGVTTDDATKIAAFHNALARQMDKVFRANPKLVDQRKKWPWLTGALGDPFSRIFFVAENPSETAVEDIDALSGENKDANLQWASTRGDRLFREALGRQRLCDGDPMRPTRWHAYITDVIKSPFRAGQYAASSWDAKTQAARLWAPVLRWELDTGRPQVVVAVGRRTESLMTTLIAEQLIPANYELTAMTHYAYVGQRAEGALGPMHPERVQRYHQEMAKLAARVRRPSTA